MPLHQEHNGQDNGKEKERNLIFRMQARSPDQRGVEASLETSSKEFKCESKSVYLTGDVEGMKRAEINCGLKGAYAEIIL